MPDEQSRGRAADEQRAPHYSPLESDDPLGDLIGGKTRILNTKLEVLALEISERLRIRTLNIERLNADQYSATLMLAKLSAHAQYHLRDHSDKRVFYDVLFGLERQRREEDVECWRDIVNVMRDLLMVWEAHEQAKVKAIFLQYAGSRD
jgi:hypothetical protein